MDTVTVLKLNPQREVTWRYEGEVLQRLPDRVVLQAFFDRQDMNLHGLLLAKGDRFVETYYTQRWFNIFEIRAHEDDHRRGWYCNICCPAEIEGDTIAYVDLALDLLVFPDGRQLVLDEDEFARLEISPTLRSQALTGLEALQAHFRSELDEK